VDAEAAQPGKQQPADSRRFQRPIDHDQQQEIRPQDREGMRQRDDRESQRDERRREHAPPADVAFADHWGARLAGGLSVEAGAALESAESMSMVAGASNHTSTSSRALSI